MNAWSRLRVAWLLKACNRTGRGIVLEGAPSVENEGQIVVGDFVFISSLPVQSHFVTRHGGRLEIGSGARIGFGAALTAHHHVVVGERAVLGPYVAIADTDFHVAGDRDAKAETTPVHIGKNVSIGSRVQILRGARIGDGAQVAAGSVVAGVVAPGERVAGVPARPLHSAAIASDTEPRDRIASVVQRVLGLREEPSLEAGPDDLAGWDSLGALKLLLALEEEFSVSLREDAVGRARAVSDLLTAIEAARSGAGT